jgi:hypothetical protein
MTAAASSSPASRPLPLFYALSQAGRAIAADRADDPWRLRMHGLGAPDLEGGILAVGVPRQQAGNEAWVDSFSGVARATGGVPFEGAVTIGSLWNSLPEIVGLQATPCNAPTPLTLVPYTETLTTNLFDAKHLHATVVFDGTLDDLVPHLNTHFPTSGGAEIFQPFHGQPILPYPTNYGSGFRVWWPIAVDPPTIQDHIHLLNSIAPGGTGFEARWLRPAVGGAPLSSLLSWWALLFGLSMLARYEPAGWATVLDVESSQLAVPLEQLLDVALERVPELIIDALTTELN